MKTEKKNTTEGMSARDAMRWCFSQPDWSDVEYLRGGTWYPADFLEVVDVARLVQEGVVFRLAAPKPAAPERVWAWDPVLVNGPALHAAPYKPDFSNAVEYIRKDIAEAVVPRGRLTHMRESESHSLVWFECPSTDPAARRVLILDGDGQPTPNFLRDRQYLKAAQVGLSPSHPRAYRIVTELLRAIERDGHEN